MNLEIDKAKPGEEPGEFRGGDPEELAEKKAEKEEELREEGNLDKAKPGEEPGEFRGGDPEELAEKKAEKEEERKELGEGEGEQDEMDPDEVAALAEEEAEKEEEKSVKAGPIMCVQVSPVDTGEDYRPLNAQGDPVYYENEDKRVKDYPNIKLPERTEENKNLPWSTITGIRIPLVGNPWFQIRSDAITNKKREEAFGHFYKSFDSFFPKELLPISDLAKTGIFYFLNLNRGILFDPNAFYDFEKAYKGQVVSPHIYIHRKMGKNGKWEYNYSEAVHSNHGIEHTLNPQGHTIEVPKIWNSKMDPNFKNPEGGFEYARNQHLKNGGVHEIKLFNSDTLENEPYYLKINPQKEKKTNFPLELHKNIGQDPDRLRTKKSKKRFERFSDLENYARTRVVNTEHDIEGKPWFQWYEKSPGIFHHRYHPESRFKEKPSSLRLTETKEGWSQIPRVNSYEKLKNYIKNKLDKQRLYAGISTVPERTEEEKTQRPLTSQIEQGYLSSKLREENKPTEKGNQKILRIKWDNPKEGSEIISRIVEENKPFLESLESKAIQSHFGEGSSFLNEPNIREPLRNALKSATFMGVANAIHSYNPAKGFKLTTHLKSHVDQEHQRALKEFRQSDQWLRQTKIPFGETQGFLERYYAPKEKRELQTQSLKEQQPSSNISEKPVLLPKVSKSLLGLFNVSLNILKKADESGLLYYKKIDDGTLPLFFYKDQTSGNLVKGSNAPIGNEDFVPELGQNQFNLFEPNPQTNPEFFDENGKKLTTPVPLDANAEINPEYKKNKNDGEFWVKRFENEELGGIAYSYYYHDFVDDKELFHFLCMRIVDLQLPKIRAWYKELLNSENPNDQILALAIIFMDQLGLNYKNIFPKLLVGNLRFVDTHKILIGSFSGKNAYVTLDDSIAKIFQNILETRKPEDLVFSINGDYLDCLKIGQILEFHFGVTPGQIRDYGLTKGYIDQYHRLVDRIQNPKFDFSELRKIKNNTLENMVKRYSTFTVQEIMSCVDSICAQAVWLSVFLSSPNQISISKARKLDDTYTFQGMPISIETKRGNYRHWFDPHNKEHGKTKMYYDYGYIKRTKGVDGDHVDVYVGDDEKAKNVYVIHQLKAPNFKEFDEDKCMVGFSSEKEAKEAYLKHYNDPRFFGSITAIPIEKFKEKAEDTFEKPQTIKSIGHLSDIGYNSEQDSEFSEWIHLYPVHTHCMVWNNYYQSLENTFQQAMSNPSGMAIPVSKKWQTL